MKNNVKISVLVMAMVVAIGGFVMAETEVQTMTVMVDIEDSGSAEVSVNGDVHAFKLEDIADGEEQTFTTGEHTIVVRRNGDELTVLLDGNEIGSELAGCDGLAWVSEGEGSNVHVFDHEALAGHKVMFINSEAGEGADGEAIVLDRIHEIIGEDGEVNIEVITSMFGSEKMVINVDEGSHADGQVFIKKMGHHSGVRYHCDEDGTEIKMSREKATQDAYMCPVCGREMSKVEAPQVRVMRIETKTEESDD